MLQFNRSQVSNSNVVYLNTVDTGSAYYDDIAVVYSQSYDNSNGIIPATLVSAPTQYNQWLMFTTSGSLAPDYTGQYDVGVWTSTFVDAIWNQVAVAWDSFNEIWDEAGEDTPQVLLYSDRAWISGSNESNITQYVSPNENGTYITYNG